LRRGSVAQQLDLSQGDRHAFVRDMAAGITAPVSVNTAGTNTGDNDTDAPFL
jgi:hypothetical protein